MIRNTIRFLAGLSVLLLAACSGGSSPLPVNKAWKLDSAHSRINLFVVKADQVGENFILSPLSGSVSPDGPAQVIVPLASIQSGIAVRNARMEKYLFETDKFPDMELKTFILPKAIADLQDGKPQATFDADVSVALHGITRSIPVHFAVTRLADDRVQVQSQQPIAIEASDFGMEGGVNKLRELAGLSSITPVVAVTFSLEFAATPK